MNCTEGFDHFNPAVPQPMRQALLDLALHAEDEINSFENSESFGDPQITEIYGIDPGGFIPFQSGGYETSVFIRCDSDDGYNLNADMRDFAETCRDTAQRLFCEELGIKPEEFSWDSLNEEQKERVYEYEQNEPALLRFECWVDDEEKGGKVFLRLSTCTEAPYYRSKYDCALAEVEFEPGAFLALTPEKAWAELLTKRVKD